MLLAGFGGFGYYKVYMLRLESRLMYWAGWTSSQPDNLCWSHHLKAGLHIQHVGRGDEGEYSCQVIFFYLFFSRWYFLNFSFARWYFFVFVARWYFFVFVARWYFLFLFQVSFFARWYQQRKCTRCEIKQKKSLLQDVFSVVITWLLKRWQQPLEWKRWHIGWLLGNPYQHQLNICSDRSSCSHNAPLYIDPKATFWDFEHFCQYL